MHKQHEREDFVHTEGPSYKSHFIVHDEDYERYIHSIKVFIQTKKGYILLQNVII